MVENELSEFISLIQFEIQKSFDLSEVISKIDVEDKKNTSKIHVGLQELEIEIPIKISMEEITTNTDELISSDNNQINLNGILRKPFNMDYISKGKKLPKDKITSKVIKTQVVGFKELIPESEKSQIGRIKIKAGLVLD